MESAKGSHILKANVQLRHSVANKPDYEATSFKTVTHRFKDLAYAS